MIDSVRTKLTFWYAGVLGLSLVAFAFLIYYAAAAVFYERQDEALRSTAETVASAYMEELDEEQSVTKANEVVLSELVFPHRYVQVIDLTGKPTAWSGNVTGNGFAIPASALSEARQAHVSFVSVNGLRVAVVPLSTERSVGFATVAEPLSVIDSALSRLRRAFVAGVPLVLLLASVGGYLLARKSLSPIAEMNRQTQRISAEQLSSRLDVANSRDEVGQLAITINELLSRLENSFREQQRFIADASHELRTPLAVLRGETEVALSKSRTVAEYEESLALIKDEAERLTRIVEDLFILARQPIQTPIKVINDRVCLNDVVTDCSRAAQVLANRKGVRLTSEAQSTSIVFSGDEELLKRMVLNLLDNAVKYTPEGGDISVAVARENGTATIVVSDTGIGISETDQEHVFDRFYRVDKARSRALGGAGLGLSIVSWIANAHGGEVLLESALGKGSAFTVKLPIGTAPFNQ